MTVGKVPVFPLPAVVVERPGIVGQSVAFEAPQQFAATLPAEADRLYRYALREGHLAAKFSRYGSGGFNAGYLLYPAAVQPARLQYAAGPLVGAVDVDAVLVLPYLRRVTQSVLPEVEGPLPRRQVVVVGTAEGKWPVEVGDQRGEVAAREAEGAVAEGVPPATAGVAIVGPPPVGVHPVVAGVGEGVGRCLGDYETRTGVNEQGHPCTPGPRVPIKSRHKAIRS